MHKIFLNSPVEPINDLEGTSYVAEEDVTKEDDIIIAKMLWKGVWSKSLSIFNIIIFCPFTQVHGTFAWLCGCTLQEIWALTYLKQKHILMALSHGTSSFQELSRVCPDSNAEIYGNGCSLVLVALMDIFQHIEKSSRVFPSLPAGRKSSRVPAISVTNC